MEVPEEERREFERTGALVRKKLLEITDLQADIHALLGGRQPTPFGSGNWQNARLEELQRVVLTAAVQSVLFEPVSLVARNDEFRVAAERLLELVLAQMKWLKAAYPHK